MKLRDLFISQMDNKGLSAKDLAQLTRINIETINIILKGAKIEDNELEIICHVLDLNPNDLPVENPDLNMTIHEAAVRMHKSDGYVKAALRNGSIPGSYVEGSQFGGHIPRLAFEQYMGMRDSGELKRAAKFFLGFVVEEVMEAQKKKHPIADQSEGVSSLSDLSNKSCPL